MRNNYLFLEVKTLAPTDLAHRLKLRQGHGVRSSCMDSRPALAGDVKMGITGRRGCKSYSCLSQKYPRSLAAARTPTLLEGIQDFYQVPIFA